MQHFAANTSYFILLPSLAVYTPFEIFHNYYQWLISLWWLQLSLGCLCTWLFLFNHGFRIYETGVFVLQLLTSRDVSASGLYFRILDWTRYRRIALRQMCIPNWDILQESSRLCNWLSLWFLVLWIKHSHSVRWYTLWKSNFQDLLDQQLVCKFCIAQMFLHWLVPLFLILYIYTYIYMCVLYFNI